LDDLAAQADDSLVGGEDHFLVLAVVGEVPFKRFSDQHHVRVVELEAEEELVRLPIPNFNRFDGAYLLALQTSERAQT
jgi:hypothetical protein